MTQQKTLTILLTQGPYVTEVSDIAIKTALAAKKKGYMVHLFLYLDGTWNSHIKGEKSYNNLGAWIRRALRKGINVTACERCSKARDLTENGIIEGVKITGLYNFIDLVGKSDKVLTFGGC
jgi:tRNA 2-thiouridine synthesizing protein D